MLRNCILVAALTLLPCHAMAGIVDFSFSGKVTDVGQPVFGINPAFGSAVTGGFSYDTALAPFFSIPFRTDYQVLAPFRFFVDIEGSTIESGSFFFVTLVNDFGGNIEDSLSVRTERVVVDGVPTADGILELVLASRNPNTFPDDSLPDHLDLSSFDAASLGVLTRTGNNDEIIQFSVEQISVVAVPEPATWAMLFAGLGALGFAARRR